MEGGAAAADGGPVDGSGARTSFSVGFLDLLLTPAGQALLEELSSWAAEDLADPARVGRLRRGHDVALVTAALTQAELRRRARAKFALADRLYLTREGLEQASSDRTAAVHAARFAGVGRVADLCCGIGGDLQRLARGRAVLAVDRDPTHLRLAAENAAVAGIDDATTYWCGDVASAPLRGVEGVFVDPARRAGGQRFRPGTSSPPLAWCTALTEAVPAVGVKAAPGVPADVAPPGWELEFLSDGRELKEALLWSPALATAARRATLLPSGASLVAVPGGPVAVTAPHQWLLDPDPAVTRAGLVEDLARLLGASKIDRQVAFLTSTAPIGTPFARCLEVLVSEPFSAKALRRALVALDAGSVDIRKRGSAVDVDLLRRRLRLEGHRRFTVVLTRADDRPWMLVCRAADGEPGMGVEPTTYRLQGGCSAS